MSRMLREPSTHVHRLSRLPERLRSSCMLALGAWTLGQLLTPDAALAQSCNNAPNPQRPTPGTVPIETGRVFTYYGDDPDLFVVVSDGAPGCDGAKGAPGDTGEAGKPGQPGGGGNIFGSTLRFEGAPGRPPYAPDQNAYAAPIYAFGGNGGRGGQGGDQSNTFPDGGPGGAAGAGGVLTAGLGSLLITTDPSGRAAWNGVLLSVAGGVGGFGGEGSGNCCYEKKAGDAAAGGAGGEAKLTASGTINAVRFGARVSAAGGIGGDGGAVQARALEEVISGIGGNGGAGGRASLIWENGTVASTAFGLVADADGGDGRIGGYAGGLSGITTGVGGVGGTGGTASVTLDTTGRVVNTTGQEGLGSFAGVLVSANGGDGGDGGRPSNAIGVRGGNGGNGGAGGTASALLLGQIDFEGAGASSPGYGVFVQSNGGAGGRGASIGALEGSAGGGGFAGAGGAASVTLGSASQRTVINTINGGGNGALVQSIGGAGGDGGRATFNASGGAGRSGGNGGAVSATSLAATVTTNDASTATLIAHSVGGGGGVGGDVDDFSVGGPQLVIGGNGGLGGNGGTVTLNLGADSIFASLDDKGGAGILAQSIGGAGGAGGLASSRGVSFLAMTVGGDAGGGGSSNLVDLTSASLVTTYGDHATGLHAQSIGGGGGKGGAGFAFAADIVPTAAISVGGLGGGGGPAGPATIANTGQVSTFGPDAEGLKVQSVGGGGGSGGAATARAIDISPDKRIPAISVAVATGGAGGAGNTGGTATLGNSGTVTTAGEGASALFAQSVGGGGGDAGDSTAAAYSGGDDAGFAVSVSVAVGGKGGTGGVAGAANLTNSGLLLTYGTDAFGIINQSIGGGGGAGGAGDASATSAKSKGSFTTALGVGGTGGTGGHGGVATTVNSGGVVTGGDGADGVFAQSVGGGGGVGGGGTGAASGGSLVIAVGVGGSGGAGGDGSTASISNAGGIVTRGTDAIGLFAQSVGGGGGKGGKAGATSGGVTDVSQAQELINTFAAGLNLDTQVTEISDTIFKIGEVSEEALASVEELKKITKQKKTPKPGEKPKEEEAKQLNVSVAVGGRGGAAGKGGDASVTNTGQVATFGAQSDAVFVQSVGGGGGSGGASTSTGSATDDDQAQTAVGVGGKGGAAGDGGAVTATNAAGATIETQGIAGFGIVAHSVGGGGGEAGVAGSVSGSLKSLSVSVAGDGGAQGTGGAVTVVNDGSIVTGAKHAIGIVAQSIGGGGGLVRSMTDDETFDPEDLIDNPQGRLADVQGLGLSFNGKEDSRGDGGVVLVTSSGGITTAGLGAHAIFAQSIGGGGGLAVGGQVKTASGTGGGDSGSTLDGNGGFVTVNVSNARYATAGDGASVIFAQSIGGGGGTGGDLSAIQVSAIEDKPNDLVTSGVGGGADVNIAATGAQLSTSGKFAPVIYGQSIGGGGGVVNFDLPDQDDIMVRGTGGGLGNGDNVTVRLVDSTVTASGAGSAGVVLHSAGGTGAGFSSIAIELGSSVTAGNDADVAGQTESAAIRFISSGANAVYNKGRIVSTNLAATPAVLASNSVDVINAGTIVGPIAVGAKSSLENQAGGLLQNNQSIELKGGVLTNAGTLQVGGGPDEARLIINGDFVQEAGGTLLVSRTEEGVSDLVEVFGNATVNGTVRVNPIDFAFGSLELPILASGGTLSGQPQFVGAPSAIYKVSGRIVPGAFGGGGTGVYVRVTADYKPHGAGLSRTQDSLADNLQSLSDGNVSSFEAGFRRLGSLTTTEDYVAALQSLAGQEIAALSATRYEASQWFARATYDCSDTGDGSTVRTENGCVWARIAGVWTDREPSIQHTGYDWRGRTIKFGGQHEVGDDLFLGGALAYENGRLNENGDAVRADSDAVLGALSLKKLAGRWTFAGAVDVGYGWIDSEREVALGGTGTARASTNALNVGAHLRAAYTVPLGRMYLEPALEGDVNHVRLDGYTERGAAPFDLDVRRAKDTVFALTPSLKFGSRFATGQRGSVDIFAGAGVSFLQGNDYELDGRFIAAGTAGDRFRIRLDDDGVVARLTGGVQLSLGDQVDFRLQYEGRQSKRVSEHGGSARLTYRF